MNPLKLIKKKNFYSQEKINSIDFQEIEEKGGKLFKKVYKKIKWEKIDYEEITSDTFDDINWEFVNFKKAVKSKTFDIDKIDFEEAELSKTFKFLNRRNPVESGGTPGSTTSKGDSDSSSFKQMGIHRNDEVEVLEYSSFPDSKGKNEFNDRYLVYYRSTRNDWPDRWLTIQSGEFKYDSNGSLTGIGRETELKLAVGSLSSDPTGRGSFIALNEYYFDPSFSGTIVPFGFDNLNGYNKGRTVEVERFPDRESLLSSEIYGRLTSLPQFSQFFEGNQWYLQTVEESNLL